MPAARLKPAAAAVVLAFSMLGQLPAAGVASTEAPLLQEKQRPIGEARALATAKRLGDVAQQIRLHPGAHWDAKREQLRWRLQLWTEKGELVAEVFVDRHTGKVLEQWTGFQAAWSMARGYPGAFGHSASALWVWLPLLAAFVIGLLPRGRPNGRWLDVLAVAALSASFGAFNRGWIELSTPLLYPPMLWLLARMLRRGLHPPIATPVRRTLLPAGVMIIGIVFLIGFRAALVAADGNVIDVGEASVIGADRLASGKAVYGHFPKRIERGDTYGPSTWAAYAPFALLLDVGSKDGRLAAAAVAAAIFDLLCLALIALLGWRLRGPPAAIAAAWFWVTCPFTLYAQMCGVNDGLAAAGVALALVSTTIAGSRGALLRGMSVVVSALTKLAGLALLPVYTRVRGSSNLRSITSYAVGCSVAFFVLMLPYLDDPVAVWDRTIGYQDARGAPFSAWGLYGLPHWTRVAWEVVVLLICVVATFVPKAAKRDGVSVAALSVAVLIAVQLSAIYWFYTYLVWFLPALAVVVAVELEPAGFRRWLPGGGSVRSPQDHPPRRQ